MNDDLREAFQNLITSLERVVSSCTTMVEEEKNKEIASMQTNHKAEIESMLSQHKAEISSILTEHKAEIESLSATHQENIESIKQNMGAKIEALEASNHEMIEKYSKWMDIENQNVRLQNAKVRLEIENENRDKRIQFFEKETEYLQNENNELRTKLKMPLRSFPMTEEEKAESREKAAHKKRVLTAANFRDIGMLIDKYFTSGECNNTPRENDRDKVRMTWLMKQTGLNQRRLYFYKTVMLEYRKVGRDAFDFKKYYENLDENTEEGMYSKDNLLKALEDLMHREALVAWLDRGGKFCSIPQDAEAKIRKQAQ